MPPVFMFARALSERANKALPHAAASKARFEWIVELRACSTSVFTKPYSFRRSYRLAQDYSGFDAVFA